MSDSMKETINRIEDDLRDLEHKKVESLDNCQEGNGMKDKCYEQKKQDAEEAGADAKWNARVLREDMEKEKILKDLVATAAAKLKSTENKVNWLNEGVDSWMTGHNLARKNVIDMAKKRESLYREELRSVDKKDYPEASATKPLTDTAEQAALALEHMAGIYADLLNMFEKQRESVTKKQGKLATELASLIDQLNAATKEVAKASDGLSTRIEYACKAWERVEKQAKEVATMEAEQVIASNAPVMPLTSSGLPRRRPTSKEVESRDRKRATEVAIAEIERNAEIAEIERNAEIAAIAEIKRIVEIAEIERNAAEKAPTVSPASTAPPAPTVSPASTVIAGNLQVESDKANQATAAAEPVSPPVSGFSGQLSINVAGCGCVTINTGPCYLWPLGM